MKKRANSLEKYFQNENEKIEPEKNNIMSKTMIFNKNTFNKFIEKEPRTTILDNKLKQTVKNINININNSIRDINFYQNYLNETNSLFLLGNFNPEYIKIREIKEISKEVFEESLLNLYSKEKYDDLEKHILNIKFNINSMNNFQSIGPFTDIEYLIEEFYSFNLNYQSEIFDKKNLLENIIFYRSIKGDGNCFYRCIVFHLFEHIILNNNINVLRRLIFEIYLCFQNKVTLNMIKGQKIIKNVDLIIEILNIIYFKLRNNQIREALKIYYISINCSQDFDLGIIWYFRYTLYNYIIENKNKNFSSQFDVYIGNLLPEQYERNGKILYEYFFIDYLLKLNTDAEKIVIYLTPYIFGIKLNIFIFNGNMNQYFDYQGKSNFDINLEMNIVNKNSHYELLYTKNYYKTYENYFAFYINDEPFKSIFLIEEKKENINTIIKDNNNNDFKLLSDSSHLEYSNTQLKENEEKNIKNSNYKSIDININEQSDENEKKAEKQNNNSKTKVLNKLCKDCKKKSEFLELKENKIGICENCLIKHIKEECLSQYYIFIENKEEFKLSELQLNIKGHNYDCFTLINLLKKINPHLTINNFQNTIKSLICILCKKELNERDSNISLKCGCCICIKCTINLIYGKKNSQFFECLCKHYTPFNDIFYLCQSIIK